MIGTGVFTSLGYQLLGIQNVFALIMLWLVGGLIALCGALTYGELASAMPRSGGEYHYLSVILHPLVGFLSGWISVTVGFAAPAALAVMAMAQYVNAVFPNVDMKWLGYGVVIVTTIFHCFTVKHSSRFQDITTVIKIVLIVVFIVAGLMIGSHQPVSLLPASSSTPSQSWTSIFSSSFAVSLIYVSYAYSGWNASAYMANDIENPRVNIPKSLVTGTLVVMVLYVLLNFIFLWAAPMAEMTGKTEVGYISGIHIFGNSAGNVLSLMIALLMISTVSSYVFVGPRVSQVMGEDLKPLAFLAKTNKHGVPVRATILQAAIAILLISTSEFKAVLTYVGFTLSLFTFATVCCLFVMRISRKDLKGTYKTLGYPVTPVVFLILTGWTLFNIMKDSHKESLWGMATIAAGSIIYFIGKPSE
jgi:APA family basic amino acid/polyamine antiporter